MQNRTSSTQPTASSDAREREEAAPPNADNPGPVVSGWKVTGDVPHLALLAGDFLIPSTAGRVLLFRVVDSDTAARLAVLIGGPVANVHVAGCGAAIVRDVGVALVREYLSATQPEGGE